jgi:AcrR family transcriptional regulator
MVSKGWIVMDKKMHILQSALECFATKGYHQSTIQDIADAAGIAKGGIYFYYKSKEELLHSVFTHYYDQMFNNVTETASRYEHDPKEGLIQQISSQFQGLTSNYSFITLFSREQVANQELKQVMLRMRTKFLVWFRDQAIRVYGPRIEPYAFDLSALLTSLVREYMSFIIINDAPLPLRRLSEYIVARLDDAARGVLSSQEPPMLTTSFVKSVFPDARIVEGSDAARRLSQAMTVLLQRIDALDLEDEARRSVRDAAAVMKEEAGKPIPRRTVLEGMLALLREKAGTAVQEESNHVLSIILEFP